MKIKKILFFFICFLTVFTYVKPNYQVVHADMGPKPSVVVDILNPKEETYYATLLSSSETTGPNSVYNEEYDEDYFYHEDISKEIFMKFVNYQDKDNYYFICFLVKLTSNSKLTWGYYPPNDFKLLIYYPDSNNFEVSDTYKTYAFDSYFKVDASKDKLVLTKNYDYKDETISFVSRVILTVVIELLVALLFKFKTKKELLVILSSNVVTQVILNVLLNLLAFFKNSNGFIFYYILLEILVVVIEMIIYNLLLKPNAKKKINSYALTSNIVSFALGILLAFIIPGLF